MTDVRYRLLKPEQYDPSASQEPVDDIYLAPSDGGLDARETQDGINVLDWDYEPAVETVDGPPEPIVREDGMVAIVRPADDRQLDEFVQTDLGTWVCERWGQTTSTGMGNGKVRQPHDCPGCERQGTFRQEALEDQAYIAAS